MNAQGRLACHQTEIGKKAINLRLDVPPQRCLQWGAFALHIFLLEACLVTSSSPPIWAISLSSVLRYFGGFCQLQDPCSHGVLIRLRVLLAVTGTCCIAYHASRQQIVLSKNKNYCAREFNPICSALCCLDPGLVRRARIRSRQLDCVWPSHQYGRPGRGSWSLKILPSFYQGHQSFWQGLQFQLHNSDHQAGSTAGSARHSPTICFWS